MCKYSDLGKDEYAAVINAWQMVFADKPYSTVSKALMDFISNETKGFAPSPGQVNDYVRKYEHVANNPWTQIMAEHEKALHEKALENSKPTPLLKIV